MTAYFGHTANALLDAITQITPEGAAVELLKEMHEKKRAKKEEARRWQKRYNALLTSTSEDKVCAPCSECGHYFKVKRRKLDDGKWERVQCSRPACIMGSVQK